MSISEPDQTDSLLNRRTPVVRAYQNNNQKLLQKLVFFVITLFLLRNIFLHDYRTDTINQLAASGKTADEIKTFVTPTILERRKEEKGKIDDLTQLKEDVATLKEDVGRLSKIVEKNVRIDDSEKEEVDDSESSSSIRNNNINNTNNSVKLTKDNNDSTTERL
eukprot:CAMPEP_0194149840 /NCGR_PEP_ID=MMETSP0152-20130528/40209_1 /TAXON_ID=1049557 /ORGANISM="Thalassiothrix antarctica, Strain L6-D1" /LENGTH=162 /DNA_ID=CAMNT_0038852327 /DNA_START=131 /DNA_END=619 /DNA_ORIENTATION=+